MKLHELTPAKGANKKAARKGRGLRSGMGKTSGRGHGGLKKRSGHSGGTRPGFEGGQMPLYMRLPKRGFVNIFKTQYVAVNVSDLEKRFENGSVVDTNTLKEVGLIKNPKDGIKVLGNGELSKKLTVKATAFSKSAIEKIEQAGGKAEVI